MRQGVNDCATKYPTAPSPKLLIIIRLIMQKGGNFVVNVFLKSLHLEEKKTTVESALKKNNFNFTHTSLSTNQ